MFICSVLYLQCAIFAVCFMGNVLYLQYALHAACSMCSALLQSILLGRFYIRRHSDIWLQAKTIMYIQHAQVSFAYCLGT
jgi:hypothetical protein